MPAFAFPDDDEPALQIDIFYQKCQCFGNAQARACQKPEKRGVCQLAKSGVGVRFRPFQSKLTQLFGRIQIGWPAPMGGPEDGPRRDLCQWIEREAIAGEADEHFDSPRPVETVRLCGQASPSHGEITCHGPVVAGTIGEPGKPAKHATFDTQLVAEGPAVLQIFLNPRRH
jgi:hypothetical protein